MLSTQVSSNKPLLVGIDGESWFDWRKKLVDNFRQWAISNQFPELQLNLIKYDFKLRISSGFQIEDDSDSGSKIKIFKHSFIFDFWISHLIRLLWNFGKLVRRGSIFIREINPYLFFRVCK